MFLNRLRAQILLQVAFRQLLIYEIPATKIDTDYLFLNPQYSFIFHLILKVQKFPTFVTIAKYMIQELIAKITK